MNVLAMLLASSMQLGPAPIMYDSYMMPGPCTGFLEGDEGPRELKCKAIANLWLDMSNILCELDYPPGPERESCYSMACHEWYIMWNNCPDDTPTQ